MIYRLLHPSRRCKRTLLRLLSLAVALYLVLDTLFLTLVAPPPPRLPAPSTPSNHGRIFIASIHWFNERILRSHWNKAVVDLMEHLGANNVYVSLIGSKSVDNTIGALQELDAQLEQLHVPRSFMMENRTHEDAISRTPSPGEPGWINTPRGKKELRRIPYLANVRNRVMQEMDKALADGLGRFDKVLWLNDVVFTTQDVLTLLSTNAGEYASACSIDFSKPPIYYDTFALRDISGAKTLTQTWPYFLSGVSQQALRLNDPIPVQSCWNGMVAMDAKPFYNDTPLRFRGIPDSLAELHLEGSECCLVHADNPLSAAKGVFLNPNVRVGYSADAYYAVNAPIQWPSPQERFRGIWKLRLVWLLGMPQRIIENVVVASRLKRWQAQKTTGGIANKENGTHCLINEMQVLVGNDGWKHL
ncbi:glycosyltransferase family 69 protein [Mytilinidion resinicola]|uniref:Glycosyltransferase family 69 protein n=1 Tax=Mytilinidion resinicola TaxID=574789 RepID=A0A6A6Y3W3_9PEZI|nr:glycosyltransferase family 69 protein [Mytilinidion resinicola]KAF2803319.1 glycosyltransferase family 69 protein [Mytilinidion resinicola]